MNFRTAFEQTKPGGPSFRHTELDLVCDEKKRPYWNFANAVEIMSKHVDWLRVLAFNEFTDRREVLRPIPGQRDRGEPREVQDVDYVAAARWFNENGFPRATMQILQPALQAACAEQRYDPLVDHLDSLKWDGTPRTSSWLSAYCGAVGDDYVREVGKRWLISAVARAYKPGCKADCMLVLEGDQGRGKSTALQILATEPFFGDALPPMGSKEASSYLRGKWIVEVAELEAMRREVDVIKAFLSRQREDFRKAYGREEEVFPRRCVFAGTTNKDEWHRDETGGRRFWPVKVGVIDTDALRRDRDQLWAEAVHLYRQGERWWLDGAVEAKAKTVIAERAAEDPWAGPVRDFLDQKTEVSVRDALASMGIETPKMERKDSLRMADLLKREGWERAGRFSSGRLKGQARFAPIGERG